MKNNWGYVILMKKIKSFLYDSSDKIKSAYIWNTSSAMLNAFQTVFILMLISRIDPIVDAGVFTIAFAIGNLMMTIGKYGIRQYQVSDIEEKYSYREYVFSRIITSIVAIIFSIIYVGYNSIIGLYDSEKCIVIILVCLAKIVDAFEDIFHGMLQQNNRLDIAGKVLTVRMIGYILVYMVIYGITGNLVAASGISLIVTLIMFVLLNYVAIRDFPVKRKKQTAVNIFKLLKECFPLFVASYLVMYIGNAPKYAIDKVMSSEEQACFNYIFMPVFVIGLMSQFAYQPVISKLALMWAKKERKKFEKIIWQQILIILGLTVVVLIGGYLLGIPVLSLVYGVDLKEYKAELLVLLVGGGALAFINFFQMIITVARRQNWLFTGYLAWFLIFIVLGKYVVANFGIIGISSFYDVLVSGLALFFGILTVFAIKKM